MVDEAKPDDGRARAAAAVQAELRKIQDEANQMVTARLATLCAELRVENGELRKALAEKTEVGP